MIPVKFISAPHTQWFSCCEFYDGGCVVVDSLFSVAPIVCVDYVLSPCSVM